MATHQQLLNLLRMTLSAKSVQQAETMMFNARTSQGFIAQLLLIVADNQQANDLRLAALVNIKTTVDQCYVNSSGFQIAQQDKTILRESILQALIRCCDQQRLVSLFAEVIYSIAKRDYPTRWPSFLEKLALNLKTSTDFSNIYGTLVALKALVSIYSDCMVEEKSGLFQIVAVVFPSLQQLTQKLFQSFNDQTAQILLLVLKVFGTATYGDLPPNLKVSDSLHMWLIFFKKILDFEFGPHSSERILKLKYRAAKIVYRFIQHHANLKYDKTYAEYFLGRYSVPFLESYVLLLVSPLTNNQKTKMDKLAMLAFPYLYRWKPCQERLDFHRAAIIPMVLQRSKLTPKDMDTWVEDPAEFIHAERENRKEPIEVLRMYADSPQMIVDGLVNILKNPNSSDIDREIYMFVFGELPNEISEKIDQPILIDILTNYIVPTMGHSSELLKARACEVFTSYIDLPLAETTLEKAAASIYQCFMAGSLPIRTHAARALSDLLVKYDHLAAFIQPYLTDLLANYLKLIDSIDAEDVVYSFESLVNKLGDRIQPYAVGIVRNLQDVFYKFCEKENSAQESGCLEEQDEENQQNAGTGCLAAIRQVLSSNLAPESYQQLTPDLYRLVSFILTDESYSFLEQGLNILNLFVFKIGVIPDTFLEFYPVLIYMIIGVPIEVMSLPNKQPTFAKIINNISEGRDKQILTEVIGSLRNYIAKLKQRLFLVCDVVGVPYSKRMWQAIEYTSTCKDDTNLYATSNKDQQAVCETLLITLLENNLGSIDGEIQAILNFVINELRANMDNARLRLINLEVLVMCFIYDSARVVQFLDNLNYTDSVLTVLLQNTYLFKADFEKQRLMFGLIKFLERTEKLNAVSPALKYVQSIVKYMVQLAVEIVKLRMDDGKSQSEASEAQEDNSHVFNVANQHHNQKEHEDEDAEIEWEDEFNKLYFSPLEYQDEIGCLRTFLQTHGRYTSMLSVQEQQLLSQAVTKSEELSRTAKLLP